MKYLLASAREQLVTLAKKLVLQFNSSSSCCCHVMELFPPAAALKVSCWSAVLLSGDLGEDSLKRDSLVKYEAWSTMAFLYGDRKRSVAELSRRSNSSTGLLPPSSENISKAAEYFVIFSHGL